MLNSGRIVGLLDVTGAEMRGLFGDLQVSHFLQSIEEEGQCGWCVVFEFCLCLCLCLSVCLSVCLSLSLSLSLSQLEFWVYWCQLPSFDLPCCREICLLYRFSLLIGSDWVFGVFYCKVYGLAKNYFELFFFFTNFIDISLCTDPMWRNLFFSFWRKS